MKYDDLEKMIGEERQESNEKVADAYGRMIYMEEFYAGLAKKAGFHMLAAVATSMLTAACWYLQVVFFAGSYQQGISKATVLFWAFMILSVLTLAVAYCFWGSFFSILRQLFTMPERLKERRKKLLHDN